MKVRLFGEKNCRGLQTSSLLRVCVSALRSPTSWPLVEPRWLEPWKQRRVTTLVGFSVYEIGIGSGCPSAHRWLRAPLGLWIVSAAESLGSGLLEALICICYEKGIKTQGTKKITLCIIYITKHDTESKNVSHLQRLGLFWPDLFWQNSVHALADKVCYGGRLFWKCQENGVWMRNYAPKQPNMKLPELGEVSCAYFGSRGANVSSFQMLDHIPVLV